MKLSSLLLALGLLAAATGCKKDNDASPATATTLLTGTTWKDTGYSLVINGVEGTQAPTDNYVWQFTSDKRLTLTDAQNKMQTATWALANQDTELALTSPGKTTPDITYGVLVLTSSRAALGYRFTQAQIQADVNGQAIPGTLPGGQPIASGTAKALLLSAGSFQFPAGTPTLAPSQVTSLELRRNLGPK